MSKSDDKAADKGDINDLLLKSLEEGANSLDKHRYKDGEPETKKLLGLIDVDPAFAYMGEVMYHTFIGKATAYLTPKTYATVQKLSKNHLNLSEIATNRTAATAAFAVSVGAYAFPEITKIYESWGKHRDEKQEIIEKISPVLDDLKGRHGYLAYRSVSADQNGMVAFDRWRREKVAHTDLMGRILPTLVAMGPNIWFNERDVLKAAQTGRLLDSVKQERLYSQVAKHNKEFIAQRYSELNRDSQIFPNDVTHEHVSALQGDSEVKRRIDEVGRGIHNKKADDDGFSLNGLAGQFGSNALLTKLSNKWVESSKFRIKKQFTSPYTALEMVLALKEQLGNEPKPHSFQLPKGGRSVPLEAYVAEIMMQHQRDMATMSAEYAVIRDALRENVLSAAKPLAEALRKGDIGALSLVDYIGGGKIIRNKGRLIASGEEVEAMIEHGKARAEAKPATRCAVDPKDFWADASYNAREAKEAFAALEGEERQFAISLVPHALRKQFGIAEKESNEVDAAMDKHMEQTVAEAILGVNELDDEALHKDGLAKTEIAQLRKAAERIEREGVAAVHDLTTSETHPNGVDRLLLGVAVGSAVKGDKVHLGRLLKDGREKLKDVDANESANEPGSHHKERAHARPHADGHAKREDHRRTHDAANHDHHRGVSNGH